MHAHSILANTNIKGRELRYYIYCGITQGVQPTVKTSWMLFRDYVLDNICQD